MTSQVEIGLRPMSVDDENYVRVTWLEHFKRYTWWTLSMDPNLYDHCHRQIISNLLGEHTCVVAYDPQSPRTIWGFVVGDNYEGAPLVHYVYVPVKMLGWGIAQALLRALGWKEGTPVLASHLTHDLRRVQKAGHFVVYNPYLMFEEFRSILHGKTTPRQSDRKYRYEWTYRPRRKRRNPSRAPSYPTRRPARSHAAGEGVHKGQSDKGGRP